MADRAILIVRIPAEPPGDFRSSAIVAPRACRVGPSWAKVAPPNSRSKKIGPADDSSAAAATPSRNQATVCTVCCWVSTGNATWTTCAVSSCASRATAITSSLRSG